MTTVRPQGRPAGSGLRAASRVGPAVVCLAVIFVLGSVELPQGSGTLNDKTAHLLVFGGLVLPLARALGYFQDRPLALRLGRGAVLSSLAGGLLEVWQAFLPHRTAELLDWVADTAGAFGVAIVVAVALRLARGL